MKKIFLTILILPLISLAIAQEVEKINPVFWKIEAEKPVYLLGTIHMGIDAKNTFPDDIWKYLGECSTLVLELDMKEMNDPSLFLKMQLPPSKSLEKILGKEHWEKLVTFLKPYPGAFVTRFKPWAVQALMAQKLFPNTPSVEEALSQKASLHKMKMFGLETMDEQLNAIESIPEEKMAEGIKQMLDDIPEQQEKVKQMLQAYKDGDIKMLTQATLESDEIKHAPEMLENVIIQRNKNWIPKIEKYIQEGNIFIAVGAGHFLGDEGVISLLEKKGYKISRIQFK